MENSNISKQWFKLFATLTESQRRWSAAIKSLEIGYGGVSQVSRATGLSRQTITNGIKEVNNSNDLKSPEEGSRTLGGGRKAVILTDEELPKAIEKIMSETTAGDPMSSLKWTCKSVRNIEAELKKSGFDVSYRTVHRLLVEFGYSLQSNRKTLSRADHPDRDRQFRLINRRVSRNLARGQPVISVDAKKKEQVGNFSNKGTTWRKKGDPKLTEDHDFSSRGNGKVTPYGAYDVGRNQGFVNVGISSDTAEFAVNSILRWWQSYGIKSYPSAEEILICADGGGSNGSRNRLWKLKLQAFSNKTGLKTSVCHYPPGTSKWNKIEHRMFSYISSNWRGQPLDSLETVVQLIGSTKTNKGLKIGVKVDKRIYQKGKKVTDEQLDSINLTKSRILPQWNYSITPNL